MVAYLNWIKKFLIKKHAFNLQKGIRAGVLLYLTDDQRIRCKVRQPPSLASLRYLNYLQQIYRQPIEIEFVDETAFQASIHLFKQARNTASVDHVIQNMESKLLQLIVEAYKSGCSDVHFENYRDGIRIFFRREGQLFKAETWPTKWQQSFIRFVKFKARMDGTQTHLPQNGQFEHKIGRETIFCRVSTLPCLQGESFVFRLHISEKVKNFFMDDTLKKTHFSQKVQAVTPGLWLITGPIGHGKTTTYYFLLNQLYNQRIISLEDPIEIPQSRLLQMKITKDIDADAQMHDLLRQDINVIGFGEIRSAQQLTFVVNAALTGHCVLATFHANSLQNVARRLKNFGYNTLQQKLFLGGILFQHWISDEKMRRMIYKEKIAQ